MGTNSVVASAIEREPLFQVGRRRRLVPEMMDDPVLNGLQHVRALRGLARLNALSRSAQALWRPIHRLARTQQLSRLRVLDIATGYGDVPLRLCRLARRAGISLEITGVDISRRALRVAREQAIKEGASVEFRQLNAVTEQFPGSFDIVMTSLFLHHLEDHSARTLLWKMKRGTKRLLLVHDLVRETRGLWLAYLATRFCCASEVCRTDGLRSVRAAFTLNEIRELASAAGLPDAEIRRSWPCRYLLSWQRR